MKISMPLILTLICSLSIAFACNEPQDDSPPMTETEADFVFQNGKIYTVNPSQTWAEAVAIKDGEIIFVGSDTDSEAHIGDDTEVEDLGGKMMMPGIHDVHLHPLEAASKNFQFIIEDEITDPEDYAFDLEAAVDENPGTGWILGWGFELDVVLEADRNPKEILDDIAPDRPVGIMEKTSHSIWANSEALELMGITIDSENPIGGIIMRAEDDEPNGLLMDNAGNLLIDLALPVTTESKQNDYNGLINIALPELAENGITSVCDARTYWKRDHHETWKKVEADNELTCRVNLGLWAYPADEDAAQLQTLKSLYQFDENSLLKINQIKLYSDGIVHNTTCAMHDDFLVDYFGEMTNNGVNYFTENRIAQYIAELEPIGFDFHIHAIGNRGIHEGLNAIEQSGTQSGRHRLTHVEYIDAADYQRFAQLNVTADAQVAGDFTQPIQWPAFNHLVGSMVTQNVIPLKSINDAGGRVTLSSDWDVSALNPFVGLQNAVTRAPQNLSVEDAIKAYTLNAAYVMRQEDLVGSIEVGKLADLIVLSQNIFEVSENQIGETEVILTILEGEEIYRK